MGFPNMQELVNYPQRMLGGFGGMGGLGFPGSRMLRDETRSISPILSADIVECDDSFKLIVDLPGVRQNDLIVEVSDETLTVRGHVESQKEEQNDIMHRRERHYGDVSRTIPLPAGANSHEATTCLKNGVLSVSMPKLSSTKRTVRRLAISPEDETKMDTHKKAHKRNN